MKNEYFIFHDGNVAGPFPIPHIQKQLEQKKLNYTDFIWHDENAWQMLAVYFADQFPAPVNPPPGMEAQKAKPELKAYGEEVFQEGMGISNEAIWFLYRDNTKFGPYRYLELVRLLQTNAASQDDFTWKPGFDDWQRIRQCPEFADNVLKRLTHMKHFGVDKVFIQRRFPRVPYQSEVILHDEKSVVFGAAKSISEGGAFLEVAKATHAKGDRIKIHFTPGGVGVPFNCIAEITQISKTKPIGYSVKFLYLEEEDRKRIAQYAESLAPRSTG